MSCAIRRLGGSLEHSFSAEKQNDSHFHSSSFLVVAIPAPCEALANYRTESPVFDLIRGNITAQILQDECYEWHSVFVRCTGCVNTVFGYPGNNTGLLIGVGNPLLCRHFEQGSNGGLLPGKICVWSVHMCGHLSLYQSGYISCCTVFQVVNSLARQAQQLSGTSQVHASWLATPASGKCWSGSGRYPKDLPVSQRRSGPVVHHR